MERVDGTRDIHIAQFMTHMRMDIAQVCSNATVLCACVRAASQSAGPVGVGQPAGVGASVPAADGRSMCDAMWARDRPCMGGAQQT